MHSCDYARSEKTNLLDDGVDRYLGINRSDDRFFARKICRYVGHAGVIFRGPIRTSNCALAWSGASLCYRVLPGKDRHVGDSEPYRKLDRRLVDRGHDSTNHKLIHRKRKGEKQCHTLQSEKKVQATSSCTTKTMARANRLF